MADFFLPGRGTGSGPRRSAVRAPSAQGVPQVRPASDPGLRAPAEAFGGGAASFEGAGEGLQDLGETLFRAAEKQQKDFDFVQTEEAKLQYGRVTMEEFQRRRVEDDPSRPDFMEDVGRFADARVRDALGALPEGVSEQSRERLRLDLEAQALSIRESAGVLSLSEMAKRVDDVWQQRLNLFSTQARQYPDFLDVHIDEALTALDGIAGMNADQKRDAELRVKQDLVQAAVDGELARGNFTEARALLQNERFVGIFDEQTRGALVTSIDTREYQDEERRVAKLDRIDREAKEAAKRQSDALTKEGIALAAQDGLTTGWVLERQDVLDLEDFRSLMDAANNPDGDDDRVVVADLYERIADGEDVERAALDAFAGGSLTRATMNTILSRNDTQTQKGGARTPFQRASTYLKNALRPSELNDNPDAAAAYANAEADLMTFFDDNPQAGVKQAMEYSRELATSYRLVPGTALSLPFPNWMQGDRASKQPNLDETEARLIEDLSRGRVTPDEARRRAAVINRWREFFDQQGG